MYLYLVPSTDDVERARVLKEEGNELVKKGNHKEAVDKYSESLSLSDLESATYSNRYLPHSCWPRGCPMLFPSLLLDHGELFIPAV